jgi:NADPH:quinone reductase
MVDMQQTTLSTMKAIVVDAYGPPQNARFAEIDIPKLKDGYMLVRMRAAALNAFDYKIITGAVKTRWPIDFPYVPGMDGAGEVVDVGAGVTKFRKGDAVLAHVPSGAFAEYALISVDESPQAVTANASEFGMVAIKPDALDFGAAAAIPESGLTAKTMVRAGDLKAGQTVLVIGATGGVGLFAMQLAKAEGARVIATSGPEDEEYLRNLGADDIIDYSQGDTIAQVAERYPAGIDAVFDLINMGENLLRDADVLRESGTLVSSLGGPEQSAFKKNLNVRYIQLTAHEGDLDDLARRAAEGQLQVEVARTYELSDALQALSDLMDPAKHTRGKLVIEIP